MSKQLRTRRCRVIQQRGNTAFNPVLIVNRAPPTVNTRVLAARAPSIFFPADLECLVLVARWSRRLKQTLWIA